MRESKAEQRPRIRLSPFNKRASISFPWHLVCGVGPFAPSLKGVDNVDEPAPEAEQTCRSDLEDQQRESDLGGNSADPDEA
eukprot:5666034-Pleurochrysis_carterae.AAC.1